MEFIEKILEIQNGELLVQIALDNFEYVNDRRKFIKKQKNYWNFNFQN